MEYNILNEILTNAVGSLFQKGPIFQQGLRDVSSWINKPQQQQQQQQQQISRAQPIARHESTILHRLFINNLYRKAIIR